MFFQNRLGGQRQQRYQDREAVTEVENQIRMANEANTATVQNLCTRGLISAHANDKLAMKMYNQLKAFDKTPANPIKNFEDLTLYDVCNDNVVVLINNYFSRIIKHGMVPHGWSAPGGWHQQNPKAIKATSVIKNIEPLYQILKSAFPDHPKLQGTKLAPAAWWQTAKNNIRMGLTKQRQKGVDEEFDAKTATLYIVNQPVLTKYKYGRMEHLEEADLLHIIRNILVNKQQEYCLRSILRVQLLISAYAVSRGGEVKWCRFSFWTYDPRFLVLDIGWTEVKTDNWYAMPMINFQ